MLDSSGPGAEGKEETDSLLKEKNKGEEEEAQMDEIQEAKTKKEKLVKKIHMQVGKTRGEREIEQFY